MIRNMTATQLANMMKAGQLTLIDVREPCEFENGHLEGALLFPLSHFEPGLLPDSDPESTVFYCAAGVRSVHALEHCQLAGRKFDTHLQGGINAWLAEGLPVER